MTRSSEIRHRHWNGKSRYENLHGRDPSQMRTSDSRLNLSLFGLTLSALIAKYFYMPRAASPELLVRVILCHTRHPAQIRPLPRATQHHSGPHSSPNWICPHGLPTWNWIMLRSFPLINTELFVELWRSKWVKAFTLARVDFSHTTTTGYILAGDHNLSYPPRCKNPYR